MPKNREGEISRRRITNIFSLFGRWGSGEGKGERRKVCADSAFLNCNGWRTAPYSFFPTVFKSVGCGVFRDPKHTAPYTSTDYSLIPYARVAKCRISSTEFAT